MALDMVSHIYMTSSQELVSEHQQQTAGLVDARAKSRMSLSVTQKRPQDAYAQGHIRLFGQIWMMTMSPFHNILP
jgi:hypothetical protein